MRYHDVFDEDTLVFVEFLEIVACKVGSEIFDDAVQDTEAVNNLLEELGRFLSGGADQWLVLYLFGKFVYSDKNILEVADSSPEWANHVKAPDRERPCGGNSLEYMRWHMNLFGKKLAAFTVPH